MSHTVKPIPDGYTALTPYLIVDGAAKAIEFYQKIFGGHRVVSPGGPEWENRARRAHDQ